MSDPHRFIGGVDATVGQRAHQNGAPAATTTVLIVGAGPAGLFAACELLRHGVRPRVVERRLAPHHEARGTAIQPAVLEILDRGGLIEPFLRAGVRIRRVQLLGPGLRELTSVDFAGTGCGYEFQCSLPQSRTEEILREHLVSLDLKLEFGAEVMSIEDDPAGSRVTLNVDGRTETVTAAYVLGAGGGHSVTRHSMQEHLAGETYNGRYFVADVKLRLPCPPECGRVIVGPTGFVLTSPLPADRWLIFVTRDESDTRRELPTERELGALLNERTGVDVGLTKFALAASTIATDSPQRARKRFSRGALPNTMRLTPVYQTAAPSWCGPTASSGSALRPPTKRRWIYLTHTWRRISCPVSAPALLARPTRSTAAALPASLRPATSLPSGRNDDYCSRWVDEIDGHRRNDG